MKVLLIAALSADGYIARRHNELVDWTSKEDKQLFAQLTKQAGVVVMGSRTFRTIGTALPGRRNIVYSTHELDGPNIEITHEQPAALIARLEREGVVAVAICGGQSLYEQFLVADLVDELYVTVEPVIFGQGICLTSSPLHISLRLIKCKTLNKHSVLLHYEVQK
jgi:dihydrofolate reductase